MAASTLIQQVQIDDDGSDMKAVFGEGKTIAEGVKEFIDTDTGKAMLATPNSVGGGAGSFQRNNHRSTSKVNKNFVQDK